LAQGIELVKQIYLITREGEISKDFGLRDQLRRAAISVPTNVAFSNHLWWWVKGKRLRGKGLLYNQLTLPFPFPLPFSHEPRAKRYIAKGSAGEVRSLLKVALEVDYLDENTYLRLYDLAKGLSRMLASQILAINRSLK
jgi:hypothetical protein